MSAPTLQPSALPLKANLDDAADLEKMPVDRVLAAARRASRTGG